ncbi:MAG: hypothetical protein JW982_02870 [Spirochaetes bacterium]|nr:hypothetical protein [Spirochaetota bacterium]
MAKAMSLVKAYTTNQIPFDGGFIISAFFSQNSIYTIYEITAYKNVKDIYQSPEGLTFKTDGNRTHILIEPPTYNQKFQEPVNREAYQAIPYRFSDCTIITGRRQERFMIPEEPIKLHSSFTILKAAGDNFSYTFYTTPDVYIALKKFVSDSLYNDCGINKNDCMLITDQMLETLKKFNIWE